MKFVYICEYVFDDVWPRRYFEPGAKTDDLSGLVVFDDSIARGILSDFEKWRGSIDCLLVHCHFGEGRAPAVAKAIDEIFGLANAVELSKYPQYNQYVYETLLKVAGKSE
jgi:hypothetical protein